MRGRGPLGDGGVASAVLVVWMLTRCTLVEGVVAHAGFEPAISALRGRCPSPLDECANPRWLGIVDSNHGLQIQSLPSCH